MINPLTKREERPHSILLELFVVLTMLLFVFVPVRVVELFDVEFEQDGPDEFAVFDGFEAAVPAELHEADYVGLGDGVGGDLSWE